MPDVLHLGINNPPVCHSSETSNLLSSGPEILRAARNDKFGDSKSAGLFLLRCTRLKIRDLGNVILRETKDLD